MKLQPTSNDQLASVYTQQMVKLAFMFTGYNSIAITQASVCKKQVHNKLADLRYHFN